MCSCIISNLQTYYCWHHKCLPRAFACTLCLVMMTQSPVCVQYIVLTYHADTIVNVNEDILLFDLLSFAKEVYQIYTSTLCAS